MIRDKVLTHKTDSLSSYYISSWNQTYECV